MDKQISQAKAIISDLWQFRKDSEIKPKVAAVEKFGYSDETFYGEMLF